MDSQRLRCAQAALRTVPDEYLTVTAEVVAAVDNGHSFHRGMHVGWAWGENRRGCYLDFLSEHRMAGMSADRFYPDASTESLDTPASAHQVTGDPDKDAESTQRFQEQNRVAYAWLRARGLLPPEGGNLNSQDLNEFLQTGGDDDGGR